MVKFQESGHKYFTLDNRELISVSALMHQFEPKKDWTKIAAKVAKKQGCSTQAILDLWEKKRTLGTEAGTLVHKEKEKAILQMKDYVEIIESEVDEEYKYALNIHELQDNTTYPELMIYDLEHMVCGQSDLVHIKGGEIFIVDHKTDKSIDFKAFSSDWVAPEKYLKPLQHLECCNGNGYSLKMSLYMYMIWKANKGRFKPGGITLNWCPIERDEEGIPILYEGMPKILFEKEIQVPYRKKEVMNMLATRK